MRDRTLSSLIISCGSLDILGWIVADFMATHLVLSSFETQTRICVRETVEKRLCSIVSISVCRHIRKTSSSRCVRTHQDDILEFDCLGHVLVLEIRFSAQCGSFKAVDTRK
jgi:hypothetical protein